MRAMDSPNYMDNREEVDSNVVNYLVWRYLQERGFAMAATWLGKEWHVRPDTVMPFAQYVKPNQLVSMLKDGVFLDDIRAKGEREKHRYFFGNDHGPPHAAPTYDIAGFRAKNDVPVRKKTPEMNGAATNGASESSASKSQNLSRDRSNGDAMDIDDNPQPASADPSPEPDSETGAVQSVVPLVNTLSIGESRFVSTDRQPQSLSANATIVAWPDKTPMFAAKFSTTNRGPLIAGGLNILRLFAVPTDDSHDIQALPIDPPISSHDWTAQHLAWTGRGTFVVAIQEEVNEHENPVGNLLLCRDWGRDYQPLSSHVGLILALRYNDKAKLLLTVSHGSTVAIYRVDDDEKTPPSLVCSKVFPDTELTDAVWMDDTKIIVCGINRLEILQLRNDTLEAKQGHAIMQPWYHLRFDSHCNLVAMLDAHGQKLRLYNVTTEDTTHQTFGQDSGYVTDFEFQPIESYKEGTPRLLATCTNDGVLQLWDVTKPSFTCVRKLTSFSMPYLFSLSFSPNGRYLAAGGIDRVGIRDLNEDMQMVARWICEDDDKWKTQEEPQEGDEEEGDWLHSLSWDNVGENLCFMAQQQMVVIRFPTQQEI